MYCRLSMSHYPHLGQANTPLWSIISNQHCPSPSLRLCTITTYERAYDSYKSVNGSRLELEPFAVPSKDKLSANNFNEIQQAATKTVCSNYH